LNSIFVFPLFKGLNREQCEKLSGIAVTRFYEKGQLVFCEGDEGTGFFMVLSGQVKVYKLSSIGKEQIYHFFNPGETFGEVAVFSDGGFPAYAESTNRTELSFFPRVDFIHLLKIDPALSINMLSILSYRLREFSGLIERLSLKDVSARLASYLLTLSEECNKTEVSLTIPKRQLASLLGTIPSTLSRVLTKMNTLGVIKSGETRIQILDLASLKLISMEGIGTIDKDTEGRTSE